MVATKRLERELPRLDLAHVELDHPDSHDLFEFQIRITPTTGYWQGATYAFKFTIPDKYPFSAPEIEVMSKIYHPNFAIDTGKICMNILKDDHSSTLGINSFIQGLLSLFINPAFDDPETREISELYIEDRKQLERNIRLSFTGGVINGVQFPNLVHR